MPPLRQQPQPSSSQNFLTGPSRGPLRTISVQLRDGRDRAASQGPLRRRSPACNAYPYHLSSSFHRWLWPRSRRCRPSFFLPLSCSRAWRTLRRRSLRGPKSWRRQQLRAGWWPASGSGSAAKAGAATSAAKSGRVSRNRVMVAVLEQLSIRFQGNPVLRLDRRQT